MRLFFRAKPGPEMFQEEMESILDGIPGVKVFFDSVLVHGKSRKQHDERLRAVLRKFKECGLTVRPEKCELWVEEVKFLGFVFSKKGIKMEPSRIKVLKKAKAPDDVLELRRFLGTLY